MGMVSQKLRDSARGQPCHFRIPCICNGNPETTVLAHAPTGGHRGMGEKNHDVFAAFACSDCHRAIDLKDGSLDQRMIAMYWLQAMRQTQMWWIENGLIKVVGDNDDAKPRVRKLSKIVPHDGRMRR